MSQPAAIRQQLHCPACCGEGKHPTNRTVNGWRYRTCDACQGAGRVAAYACALCGGLAYCDAAWALKPAAVRSVYGVVCEPCLTAAKRIRFAPGVTVVRCWPGGVVDDAIRRSLAMGRDVLHEVAGRTWTIRATGVTA